MKPKDKVGNLLKKYSDNTTLRASVNAIPYIGGTLDILLSSGIQKKSHERFLIFMDELENQLRDVEENKLDYKYLESEEFYDLFLRSSNLAIKTRIQEKINAYSKILRSSITSDFQFSMNAEDLLDIIEGLTENDIKLIKLISEYLKLDNTDMSNSDKVFMSNSFYKVQEHITEELILVGLLRLLNSGLIIKNHVQNAPIARQKFQTTQLFDIIKKFIYK